MSKRPTQEQVEKAVRAIEHWLPGTGAFTFDWYDGTGLRIGINCGCAYEIDHIVTDGQTDDTPTTGRLPKGTYLQVVNGESLRLLYS